MQRLTLSSLFLLIFTVLSFSQITVDFRRSVPIWLDYDIFTNDASLKWSFDTLAISYVLNELEPDPFSLTPIATLGGTANEYPLGVLSLGQKYSYLIEKNSDGEGVITVGLGIPAIHNRGRCLIAIDDTLTVPLEVEIELLIHDMTMDGWEVDTLNIPRTTNEVVVKSMVTDWFNENYIGSQALFILGHLAVPYSGNTDHDGHTNHEGAWPADVFYGDVDGVWTDSTIDNIAPAREANKNIPGDGKYDQTIIPSSVEIEVGRVDFYNLPGFTDYDEVELTRKYLNKSHEFKIGNKDYPRRGLVDNKFVNSYEGLGQSGWRNFSTMFGADSVSIQEYDIILKTDKYLCSYVSGGGSYTTCNGVGSTSVFWANEELKTIFTSTYGSYFGDWDNTDNFLRGALGSGDILTNIWAGRPVWLLHQMALGQHIGLCTKESQNASPFDYSLAFSSRSAHMTLMGDPTLRLHSMKVVNNLTSNLTNTDILLDWEDSPHATHGYFIYKKVNDEDWQLTEEFYTSNTYVDPCIIGNTNYTYMVKAIRLEETGSGTYFNTSLGVSTSIQVNENCDGIVGLHEIEGIKIQFSPNPTKDWVFIKANNFLDLDYQILNTQGQLIQSGKLVNEQINVSRLQGGIYWLKVSSAFTNQYAVEKLIVTE